MKDLTKLDNAIQQIVKDDATIRARLREFETTTKPTQALLNEADSRALYNRGNVLAVLKKMVGFYTDELNAAAHLGLFIETKTYSILSLIREMKRGKHGKCSV